MKRKVLCRITSFCLAAVLAAQSCMSVSAAGIGDYPGAEKAVEASAEESGGAGENVETESPDEADGEASSEDESGSGAENESGTENENASEAGSGSGEGTETESGTESETETETETESESDSEAGDEKEESSGTETETESETIGETLTEPEMEGSAETTETVQEMDIALEPSELSLREGEDGTVTLTLNPQPEELPEVKWESSDAKIATVSGNTVSANGISVKTGTICALAEGSAMIKVTIGAGTAGEKSAECKVEVKPSVDSVTLAKETLSLGVGGSEKLEATVAPAEKQGELKWTSSNPEIAAVAEDGTVTGVAEGNAEITAQAGKKTAVCTVTVTYIPVELVKLEKDEKELKELEIEKGGKTEEITVKLLPADASDKSFSYKIENEKLVTASVNGEEGKLVLTSGEHLGKTTVKVTACGQTAAFTVTVVEEAADADDSSDFVPVKKVTIKDAEGAELPQKLFELAAGESVALTAEILPANASAQEIEWSSANEQVAVVADGQIRAVGIGTTQITAKAENGVCDKVTVVVSNETEEVKIYGADTTLYCNADAAVFAEKPSLSKTMQIRMTDTGLTCVYRSSNEEVATVDEAGTVTAIAPGKAEIIAVNTASGKSDAITVTVERLVEEIKLPVVETTIVSGTSMKLTADVMPDEKDAKPTNTEIKWTSSNKSIASIDAGEKNVLTTIPNKTGTITVTARAEDAGHVEVKMTIHVTAAENAAKTLALTYNNKKSATVKSQAGITLNPVVKDANGTELSGKLISYKSSDETVATVDQNGRVTAVKGGSAKITGTVMDGSNVTGSFTVKVEQRPEEITFDRDVYQVAPSKSITLKPTILPSNSKSKKVKYEVVSITNEAGEAVSGITVHETNGKVKAAAGTAAGTKAVIRVTSTAFDGKTEAGAAPYKDVTVVVGTTNVKKLTMKKSSLELTGLGAQIKPEFTVKKVDEKSTEPISYVWSSSDEEILTVSEDGTVTAAGYGTAKVTLCADNAVSAVCTISVYPVKKGQQIGAVSANYGIQSAANDGNGYVQLSFINKSTKSKIDAKLLTFTSSNPKVVYVDENGIAYANPKTTIKEDTAVTVTAVLKDDPLKRKAQTTVTVWKDRQIKSIDFQCANLNGTKEEPVEGFTDFWETEYKTGKTFRLKAYAYDAEQKLIKNASLSFAVSDSSIAEITETKSLKDNAGKYITVTVKKPGTFKITCMANDKMHRNRQAAFGIYSGDPVLLEDSLGSINKKGETRQVSAVIEGTYSAVVTDTEFTLVGAYGTEILDVDIDADSIRLITETEGEADAEKPSGGESVDIGKYCRIIPSETDASKYRFAMDVAALESGSGIPAGTYEITLNVKRSLIEKVEEGSIGTIAGKIKTTFKVTDTRPSVKIAGISINSFEKGTWTKLKITTKGEVESVSITEKTKLAEDFKLRRMQDGWYIAIDDDKFDAYKSASVTGSFEVKLKGIEKPVTVSKVKVTAKSKKPSLKQLAVPDIYTKNGDTAVLEIYNSTEKETLKGYTATLNLSKNQSAKWVILNETAADSLNVQLVNPGAAGSFKQKIKIEKEGWREPVEMTVTVKASVTAPKVTFGKKAITLNAHASVSAETYTVETKLDKQNLTLKTGEWEPVNSEHAKLFEAFYEDGKLTIGLKADAAAGNKFSASSYNIQFKNVFAEAGYEDAATAKIKVTVKKTEPAIKNIKFSGKLDLLNRRGSTLTGKVTITGLDAEIENIRLLAGEDETFGNKFYCVPDGNQFTVCARSNAELTVGTYKGKVAVTLKNGSVLTKDISVKTTQSVPKLTTPKEQTLFKAVEQNAAAGNVADYNLNESMPKGVAISKVETKALPAGLGVEYDNGHAYVVLNDRAMKPGTYTIQADVYFKGAQKAAESEEGKPVRLKFKVVVKER